MNIHIKNLFPIITCTLLFFSVNCFAEWRDWLEIAREVTNQSSEPIDVMNKIRASNEFGQITKLTPGTHLTAVDKNWRDSVDLRINYGQIDYRVHIFNALSDNSCDLYLELLDADKYLIKSIYISNLARKYTGTISGSFSFLHEYSANKIKYYNIKITTN